MSVPKTVAPDDFQVWLIHMDDAIQEMMVYLPPVVAGRLDFSAESLSTLEAWLLAYFLDVEMVKIKENSHLLDGVARYIGETFRENLGGKWFLETDDPQMAHYNLPALKLPGERKIPLVPLTLVTTSVHRRKGDFLISVFRAYQRE